MTDQVVYRLSYQTYEQMVQVYRIPNLLRALLQLVMIYYSLFGVSNGAIVLNNVS